MTGCGCLLLVGALAALLYVFLSGSTDAGEQIEQAVALAIAAHAASRIAGRRWSQAIARS